MSVSPAPLTVNAMTHGLNSSQTLFHTYASIQGKLSEALNAFAEDVYHCSLEYGTEDARSAVGYYNLGKVFSNKGEDEKAAAVNDMVVKIWSEALCRVVLGIVVVSSTPIR